MLTNLIKLQRSTLKCDLGRSKQSISSDLLRVISDAKPPIKNLRLENTSLNNLQNSSRSLLAFSWPISSTCIYWYSSRIPYDCFIWSRLECLQWPSQACPRQQQAAGDGGPDECWPISDRHFVPGADARQPVIAAGYLPLSVPTRGSRQWFIMSETRICRWSRMNQVGCCVLDAVAAGRWMNARMLPRVKHAQPYRRLHRSNFWPWTYIEFYSIFRYVSLATITGNNSSWPLFLRIVLTKQIKTVFEFFNNKNRL